MKFPKLNLERHYKEVQEFIEPHNILTNPELVRCYLHFKARYEERSGKNHELTYGDYWLNWVFYLRGNYLYTYNGKMFRAIGHYIKDPVMYKVIYTKIEDLGIFVPLTIYEVSDHKKKYNMFRRILKNKNQNE